MRLTTTKTKTKTPRAGGASPLFMDHEARPPGRVKRGEASPKLGDSDFFVKVKNGATKHGLLVDFIQLDRETMHVIVSVPGGPKRGITLFECREHSALTAGGAPICAADVVCVLRRTVQQRDPRAARVGP